MRLTGTFVLVLGVFVFAGPALADNGHGNGNGNGDGAGGSPGNSANAPGQVKKDPPAASAPQTTTPTVTTITTTSTDARGSDRGRQALEQHGARHARAGFVGRDEEVRQRPDRGSDRDPPRRATLDDAARAREQPAAQGRTLRGRP